jgi:hypothetical protein
VRVCVLLGAIAFGVLAVPAMARAADTSGTAQLLQQADATMSAAQTLATQEVASTSSVVSAATAAIPPSASAAVATVQREAMTTVAATLSASSTNLEAAAAAPPSEPPAAQAAPHAHRGHTPARAHPRATKKRTGPWRELVGATTSDARALGPALPAAPARETPRDRPGPARERRAVAIPSPPPPLPVPPQNPGMGAQAGGQGTMAPLLVGALAAGLLLYFFVLLSRLPLRSAFRKPRRLVLPPWHPG